MHESRLQFVSRFESAWKQGRAPDIRQILDQLCSRRAADGSRRELRTLALDLIWIDLGWRWQRRHSGGSAAHAWVLEEYAAMCPTILAVNEFPASLVLWECECRLHTNNRPSIDEYVRRFPQFAEILPTKIKAIVKQLERAGTIWPELNGFVIDQLLGQGQFGCVYRAQQQQPRRTVAIKVLKHASADAIARFEREANAIVAVRPEHVIAVHQSLFENDLAFLVLEYAEGGSLDDFMRRPEHRPPRSFNEQRALAELMGKVARGLAAVHDGTIIHRDLAPKNILFDSHRNPKIADFGLARFGEPVSSERLIYGTPRYMSPEQVRGERDLTSASDIFSFGVMLFELLSGKPPFGGETQLIGVGSGDFALPLLRTVNEAVKKDLAAICDKCLRRRPNERYQSATLLAEDLEAFCEMRVVSARPVPWTVWLLRELRRRPTTSALAATATFAMTAALLVESARKQEREESLGKDTTIAEQEVEISSTSLRAETEKRLRRFQEYAVDLHQVAESWQRGDTARVRELLDRHEALTPDLRGFEWFYWDRLQQTGSVALETDHRMIRDIDVDRSGRYLAAADFDTLSVWDLRSQKKLRQWNINTRRKSRFVAGDASVAADDSVAFSPHGKYVAATGFVLLPPHGWERAGSLRVWEVASGKNVLTVSDKFLGGRAVAFSPDGKSVIGGGIWSGWRSWNLDSGQRGAEAINMEGGEVSHQSIDDIMREQRAIRSLDSGPGLVRTLRFTPENDRLESGDFEGSQVAWIWPDGTLANGHISQARISPGASLSLPFDDQDRILSLEDGILCLKRDEGSSFRRPGSRGVERTDLSWSPRVECFDYRRGFLAVGDVNHAVSVWRTNDGQIVGAPLIVHHGHGAGLTCVKVTDEGLVTSADAAGFIRKWPDESPEHVEFGKLGCVRLVMDEDNRSLSIVDVRGAVAARVAMREGEEFDGARISPNERFVVIGWRGTARQGRFRLTIWDLQDQREVVSRDYDGFWLRDDTVSLSADSTAVVLGGSGDSTLVLSLATGQELLRATVGKAFQLAIDTAGRRLAIGGMTSVTIWDVVSGEKLGASAAWSMQEGKTPEFWFSTDGQSLFVDGEATAVWTAPPSEPSAPDVSADAKMPQDEPRRLYRLWPSRIEIYCAQTHRRLLSVPFKVAGRSPSLNQDILIALQPVPGADGLMASVTLDRLLDGVLAQWNGASAERRDTPAVDSAGQ